MTTRINLAYCQDRNVSVDLNLGFSHCVMDHQCFSDDVCPLDGRFPSGISSKVCKLMVQNGVPEKYTSRLNDN